MDGENKTPVSIQHIREAAAARVAATSLRKVAREVGMSPTGLKKFLDGTAPYTATVHRLRVWYVRFGAVTVGELQPVDASAALEVLTHDLTATPRRDVANTVLDSIESGYVASGKSRPRWVSELRAVYGSSAA